MRTRGSDDRHGVPIIDSSQLSHCEGAQQHQHQQWPSCHSIIVTPLPVPHQPRHWTVELETKVFEATTRGDEVLLAGSVRKLWLCSLGLLRKLGGSGSTGQLLQQRRSRLERFQLVEGFCRGLLHVCKTSINLHEGSFEALLGAAVQRAGGGYGS